MKRFHRLILILLLMVFSVAGATAILSTKALTNTASRDAESGILGSGAAIITDPQAHGSAAIKFASIANLGAKGFGMSVPTIVDLNTAQQAAWLDDIKSLGVNWIRIDIDWSRVQPSNAAAYSWTSYDNIVNLAKARDIKVLGIIDYTPPWARSSQCPSDFQCMPADFNAYANYAKAVVGHFGASLAAVEIWNEPNITNFWHPQPDATKYANLLMLSYTAIKSVAPNMLVLSAGTSPACTCGGNIAPTDFLTALYAADAKNSFDAVAHHPYSFPAPPDDIQPWSAWSQMNDTTPSLRSIMTANGDSAKKIWITEVGAPTGGPGLQATCSDYLYSSQPDHVNDCLQSRIVSQLIAQVEAANWVGITFFYSYKDNGVDPSTSENFFGVIRADGSHKPAYDAIKTLLQ